MVSLEDIGILTGILSAFAAGGYFVINYIKQKRVKIRRKVNAKWVNAGEASFGSDTHNLELELEVDLEDGEIRGVVKSVSLDNESQSPLCSVVGKLGYNTSTIQIWHSRFGEGIYYGEATISYKHKTLIWNIKKDPSNSFPKNTILFKQPKF